MFCIARVGASKSQRPQGGEVTLAVHGGGEGGRGEEWHEDCRRGRFGRFRLMDWKLSLWSEELSSTSRPGFPAGL